jgi:protein TonB
MLLAVAALHIGLIAALCLLLHAGDVPPPPTDIAIPVIFAPAPAPADPSPQILQASTLPVPSSTHTASLAPLPSVTVAASRLGQLPPASPHFSPRRPPADQGRIPSAASPAPSPTLPPSPAAPTSAMQRAATGAPATSSHDMQHALDSWEARIRQAVQDAVLYPAAARLLHRDGRAQVRFDYDQGAVERVSIAQSSHFDALDNAALAAVTRAAIPAPPAELGPQNRIMLVWVQFRLETEE